MLTKRLSSIVKRKPQQGGRGHRTSSDAGAGVRTAESSIEQQSASTAGRGNANMFSNAPRGGLAPLRTRRTRSNDNNNSPSEGGKEADDERGNDDGPGANLLPPTHDEAFGNLPATNINDRQRGGNSANVNSGSNNAPHARGGESGVPSTSRHSSSSSTSSLLLQSASVFKRNDSSPQSEEANGRIKSGIEHVAIVKVRTDATPEQIEAMLCAAKSLAHLVDGVLSLSIGKIFVDQTFMVDNTHGLEGGYVMRVCVRDMDAYKGWVVSKARKAFVIEHVVPIMPQGTVPMVVAFQSEEVSGMENTR